MSDLHYLDAGLTAGNALREDLAPHTQAVAEAWLDAAVDPAVVELAAEYLARWAEALGEGAETVDSATLVGQLDWLAPPPPLKAFFERACQKPLDAARLAALALHSVDIAEAMALGVYMPELPALYAKSDRSGDAARRVGAARYLRG